MNEQTPGIGHNVGEETELSAFDKLKKRGIALEEGGGKWLDAKDRKVITDQEMADKLSTYLKQCVALRSTAKEQKKLDKAPSLAESARIEADYKKMVGGVEAFEAPLRKRLTAFEVEKARKIEEERAEAERVEQEAVAEAERLAREAEQSQSAPSIKASLDAAEAAEQAAETRKETYTRDTATRDKIGGKATGLKKKLSAVVTDHAAALAHYADTPTIRDAVADLANRSARAIGVNDAVDGQEVCPGVTLKIDESV